MTPVRPQRVAKGLQVRGQRLDQDGLHRRPHSRRRRARELVEIGGKTFRGIAARTLVPASANNKRFWAPLFRASIVSASVGGARRLAGFQVRHSACRRRS